MPIRKGITCKFYRNTASYGTPTWAEVHEVSDWKENLDWQKAAAGSRLTRVGQSVKTQLDLSWTGTLKDDGGTNAEAIKDALLTDQVLDVLILNGPITENGVRGYRTDVQVFSGSNSQGLTEVVYPEIMIAPTPSANAPKAVKITSGAPTYSPITGDTLVFA